MRVRTYSVRVLGCKVNQVEAEQIRRFLDGCGLSEAAEGERPDLAVLHSCAVTGEAERKTRRLARRLQRESRAGRPLILTGCASRADLAGSADGVVSVGPGPGWSERFAAALAAACPEIESMPTPNDWAAIDRFRGHCRAFLRIQDGCDLRCSYCIVPSLRGPSRDKPLDAVLEEAAGLARAGYRELVVTGVSVGLYGKRGGTSLASALRGLCRLEGLERIRLSSLHPGELTDELLEVWASHPNILPHLHLPLQSGSDRILRAMRRGYTGREFMDAVRRARVALDRPAFTTDVIVGFPGETEEDFQRTEEACREAGFSRIHRFVFSPRPGTPAESLGNAPSAGEAAERMERLRALGERQALSFQEHFLGETVRILAEERGPQPDSVRGYSERYIPVEVGGAPDAIARILRVRLIRNGRAVSAVLA
jgi:threonylcarbamoyladenosine tRNA methylthiotransferase MtaB